MALYDVSTSEKKASPELVAGGTLYADAVIGSIIPFGGSTAPSGWFLCQGQAVSRTTYSELFAVIGTAFGSGDGSTTFNLPDMRESVPKGAGLTGHTVGAHLDGDGLAIGEFLDDRVQAHAHPIGIENSSNKYKLTTNSSTGGSGGGLSSSSGTDLHAKSNDMSGRSGATTEVKSVGVNYIIKAKMIAVPADFIAQIPRTIMPNYARGNLVPAGTSLTSYTMPEDGYVIYERAGTTGYELTIDGTLVTALDNTGSHYQMGFSGYVKKGSVLKLSNTSYTFSSTSLKVFGLI